MKSDPDLSPLQQSVQRFHGWEPLDIEGTLPPELSGMLVRSGPGLYERFGQRLTHSFEADGAMMGLRMSEGVAHGAVRLVKSPAYLEEEAAGKPLYGSATSRLRRVCNGFRGKTKANGNTNVLHWQGQTFALMEGAPPIEIDSQSLRTKGRADLGGVLKGAFSAHPHRLDARATTFNFGLDIARSQLELYALPDEGPARVLGQVRMPWSTMVHDFAVTEHHMVFVICPAKLNVFRALSGDPDFVRYFDWEPDASAELMVVPLDAPENVLRLPIPARWVFHLSNAFERSGELVVDWVQYPDFDLFKSLSGDGTSDHAPPQVQRLVVDLKSRRLRSDELLWDRSADFPILPPKRVGQPYTSCWYSHSDDSGEETSSGITKLNVETGQVDVWEAGHGTHVSEGVFVPRPGGANDEDGWLLPLVYDGFERRSYYAVLDASAPSRGPLAKLWFDQPLPVSFHGSYAPPSSTTQADGFRVDDRCRS